MTFNKTVGREEQPCKTNSGVKTKNINNQVKKNSRKVTVTKEDERLEIEKTTQNIKKFFGLTLRKTTPCSNDMNSG